RSAAGCEQREHPGRWSVKLGPLQSRESLMRPSTGDQRYRLGRAGRHQSTSRRLSSIRAAAPGAFAMRLRAGARESVDLEGRREKCLHRLLRFRVRLRVVGDRRPALNAGIVVPEGLLGATVDNLPHRTLLKKATARRLRLLQDDWRREEGIVENVMRSRILGKLHVLARGTKPRSV